MQDTISYEPFNTVLGHIYKETVRAVEMPRERFSEIVGDALEESHASDELRRIVEPVASTMDRFPLGTWISRTRGCGCIVGEALVANEIINRTRYVEDSDYRVDVFAELHRAYSPELADELWDFGTFIDRRVRDHVAAHLDPAEAQWDDYTSMSCVVLIAD